MLHPPSCETPKSFGEAAFETDPIAWVCAAAAVYRALEPRAAEYHDWPYLAERTVRGLAFSPQCTLSKNGHTYLAPYAADTTKPPESMVQFTVLLPLLEYAAWSERRIPVADRIIAAIPSFFDSKVDCLVRWPPGHYAPGPPDVSGSKRYMDSWYLYHALFNLSRLVKRTRSTVPRDLFRRSLRYAQHVARRFEYRWPVFFDLDTLEILRAQAREGAGGENDVAGLYANVMLQAHDIFGDESFLDEAKAAAKRLRGLGFNVAYQMNTTGFASEAMLRLYLLTGEKQYLNLSYLCLANVFDNMWLWQCGYGHAKSYPTFFGMFPLPDAPYLAAYEELENAAKFREFLRLANDEVLPSVRLLLAEYCKHVLDRAWYYFPQNLAPEALADRPQSGSLTRELPVPVEDLRDGWNKCGQVGQEVYGAGIAPGLTVRHYRFLSSPACWLFCDYPVFNMSVAESPRSTALTFDIAGDERGVCSVRVIPTDPRKPEPKCAVRVDGRSLSGALTHEGHQVFTTHGNCSVTMRIA